jgi:hypothetical protein
VRPPPPDDSILPFVGSDEVGWTRSPAAHQNDSRKRFYNNGIKVLAGEDNSPFVRAVMIAEATSLVTNLVHGPHVSTKFHSARACGRPREWPSCLAVIDLAAVAQH